MRVSEQIKSIQVELASLLETIDIAADRKVLRLDADVDQDDELVKHRILGHIDVDRKRKLIRKAADIVPLDRAMGVLVGMAVGDALGHPYEFLPAVNEVSEKFFDLETMEFHREFNRFDLRRGQWTDDASMGLCMADSLILHRSFDGADMRVRFWCWWNRGYNNAFTKDDSRESQTSVGLGGNIALSLEDLERFAGKEQTVPEKYEAETEDSGNGSLMRFAPIPVYLHKADTQTLHDLARRSSYTTHPGFLAAEACALLAHLVQRALQRPEETHPDPKAFLEEGMESFWKCERLDEKSGWGYDRVKWLVRSAPQHDTESCWNWKAPRLDIQRTLAARGRKYNGYPVSAGYFGAFCMDGLAMALWSVYHTTSFDKAVARSVNFLGDADSHGSITGQLAGALYGYRAINVQFVSWLTEWDDYEFAVRALLLHYLGSVQSDNSTGNAAVLKPLKRPAAAMSSG